MARILLSAYACEPGRGSEPGVGWGWATELAELGHEVWVLTRADNRMTIARNPPVDPLNPRFIYYDLPSWLEGVAKAACRQSTVLLSVAVARGATRSAAISVASVQYGTPRHLCLRTCSQLPALAGKSFLLWPGFGGREHSLLPSLRVFSWRTLPRTAARYLEQTGCLRSPHAVGLPTRGKNHCYTRYAAADTPALATEMRNSAGNLLEQRISDGRYSCGQDGRRLSSPALRRQTSGVERH